jgi:hypothetical protein
MATSSAAAWIDRSTDGGKSWGTPLELSDGGRGFGDFGFVDATHGMAVHFPAVQFEQAKRAPGAAAGVPDAATLLLSADGGASWIVSVIR